MDSVRAVVFTGPNEVTTGEFDWQECRPDEVRVKTIYTMVSTGTELRTLAGRQEMGDGDPYYPLIPGYSVVGEVVELGSEAKGWKIGDLVSCRNPARPLSGIRSTWGGQASVHVYPASGGCQPVLLPAGARPIDYVAVELAAISGRGIRAAGVIPGETAVVLGQGMIGALSAAWLVASGARVAVTDLAQKRLERSSQSGVSAAFLAGDPDLVGRILAYTGGGADIVVESSGTMGGVETAGSLIREQRVVGPGRSIVWPRLVFQATYTDKYSSRPERLFKGEGAVVLTPGDRGVEDRNAAVEAFRTGALKSSAFVDHVLPITDAATAYDGLRTRQDEYFSVVFDWSK